jgi:hypothetical protein
LEPAARAMFAAAGAIGQADAGVGKSVS